jgi:3-hydroxyacyl-[acyl-carrier-protein] dehydratase
MQDVKFRRPVQPGHRLLLLAQCKDLRSRRAVFDTQGVVDGQVVFQGTIIGMPM